MKIYLILKQGEFMFKIFLGSVAVASAIFAADLQTTGVEVTLEDGKKATIKREA